MARFPSVRRNSVSIPQGDLTVHLADGREVNTTPAFVDANGKLFTYEDYIKGALINRFPKDDNIPFYAFTLNQKADALYEKLGSWAQDGGHMFDAVQFRGAFIKEMMSQGSTPFMAIPASQYVRPNLESFPTREFFSAASTPVDVSAAWVEQYQERGKLIGLSIAVENALSRTGFTPSPRLPDDIIKSIALAHRSVYGTEIAGSNGVPFWFNDMHAPFRGGRKSEHLNKKSQGASAFTAFESRFHYFMSHPDALTKAYGAYVDEAQKAKEAAAGRRAHSAASTTPSSYPSPSYSSSEMAPAATGSYSTPSTEITGMQYAQAMQIHQALFGGKKNPMRYRLNGMNVARNATRGVERRGALSREMHELEENRELARQEQARQAYLRELEKVKKSVHAEILEKGARLRDYVRSPSGSPLSTRAAEQWVYRHAPDYGVKPKSMYELFWKTLRDYHADEVADYLVHKANGTSTGAAAELLGRAVDSAAEILVSEAPRVTIQ